MRVNYSHNLPQRTSCGRGLLLIAARVSKCVYISVCVCVSSRSVGRVYSVSSHSGPGRRQRRVYKYECASKTINQVLAARRQR